MQNSSTLTSSAVLAIFAVALSMIPRATAQGKVLHNFNNNGGDGSFPYGELILDAAGNLYGTTYVGGTKPANGGIVFELIPQAGGGWAEKTLHSFKANGKDGSALTPVWFSTPKATSTVQPSGAAPTEMARPSN